MVKRLLPAILASLAVALSVACGGGSGPAEVKPTVTSTPLPDIFRATISPNTGPPGTEVTISGTGWGPELPVTITSADAEPNSKPYFDGRTDTSGNFNAKFRLEKTPGGAELKQGRLDLIVAGLKGNTTLSFTVEPPRPVRTGGGS